MLMKWLASLVIIGFLTVAGLNLAASGLNRLLPSAPKMAAGITTVAREKQLWLFGMELKLPLYLKKQPAYKRVLAD